MASSETRQSKLAKEDYSPVYLYYRGLQEEKLRDKSLTTDTEIRNFNEILSQLERQTGEHMLEDINIDKNPKLFLKNLLQGYPENNSTFSSALINNFCDSLKTRAREKGTYAVLIIMENSVIVCHTDAKEKTVTKDANVIERLIDADNVGRYVRFIKNKNDEIRVQHYERRLPISDSLSEWLGLEKNELSFREIGDIKIFTEIDDSTAVFQYTREEFEQKFLAEDSNYNLTGDKFSTPNDQYPVSSYKIDRESFDTVEEFKERFNTLYYDIKSQKRRYDDIANSLDSWIDPVYDKGDKVVKGSDENILVSKSHDELEILYAHSQIQLSASWKLKLAKNFRNGSELRLWHAGMSYEEPPTQIGGFVIQNSIGIDDCIGPTLHQLAEYIRGDSSGSFISDVLSYVLFTSLGRWAESPISHFFDQMSEKFEENIESKGMVLDEENGVIEYKSSEWLPESNDKLAEEIVEEADNDLKMIIVGVDEIESKCRPINGNQFKSDRNRNIASKVEKLNQTIEHCLVHTVPIEGNESLLVAVTIKDADEGLDLGMLD